MDIGPDILSNAGKRNEDGGKWRHVIHETCGTIMFIWPPTFRQMLVSHERTARMQRDARAEQTNATALAATGGGSMRQQDVRRARSAMGWHGAHTCRNRSLEAGS